MHVIHPLAPATARPMAHPAKLTLSIVIPCLNEAESLPVCLAKASQALRELAVPAEIVVADNGSTDGSIEIAQRHGARVVHVPEKGYGNALRYGVTASRGRYVLMADADDSYDFLEVPKYYRAIVEGGHDLVQGCRLPWGGGTVMPGAMPPLHRWWGNPMFSVLVRRLFKAPIHDVYCGMRIFSRELFDKLDLRSPGMEFATEMIIRASLFGASIGEVPTTLHPDARKTTRPHLRTFRDGWRTLRFFMLYSPQWLFGYPGMLLLALGGLMYALALPSVTLGPATFDVHTLLVGSLSLLVGFQCLLMMLIARVFAAREKLLPAVAGYQRLLENLPLERGLTLGAALVLLGLAPSAAITAGWAVSGFGPLEYASTLRWMIPGFTLSAMGVQTMISSSMLALMQLRTAADCVPATSTPIPARASSTAA